MKNWFLFFIPLIMISFLSCKSYPELTSEKHVEISRYMGTWYEIARLPNRFEKGLDRVSATYSLREDGKITVVNRGFKADGSLKESTGKAYLTDANEPGRLKVQFFWPFVGDYYIIQLDPDYQFVLVGEPSRKYLWILARTKELDHTITNELIKVAKQNGFDTDQLLFVQQ